jgi:hypothetical protein
MLTLLILNLLPLTINLFMVSFIRFLHFNQTYL